MTVNEALELLPIESPLRASIVGLTSSDKDAREDARSRLRNIRSLSEREAPAVLEIATQLRFPAEPSWNDCASKLLQLLWESPYPSLVPRAAEVYPNATNDVKRVILAYFGATKSRAGAEALVGCVRNHGWPDCTNERIFREMDNLLEHADVLFPELFLLAGPFIIDVGNTVLGALQFGKLHADRLKPVEPVVVENLSRYLDMVESYQQAEGVAWRFADDYGRARHHAAFFLDLAGWTHDPRVDPLIERAFRLDDPRLLNFAAISHLRRHGNTSPTTLEKVAACHEMRAVLLEMLESMGRADLFPKPWRTWEAFAAAAFVNWLIYPTELAREPDGLEKMAVYTSVEDGRTIAVYLWRFLVDKKWYAGTSGPHPIDDTPHYATGIHTFSCFDEWSEKSDDEHFADINDTLEKWVRHWSASM